MSRDQLREAINDVVWDHLPDKYGDIDCACEDKTGNVPDHLTDAIMAVIP